MAAARFIKGWQVTGADTYHPATATASYVKPNGTGITNTIGRAELATITAAILHGHSHNVTDSLSSLHKIRERLLYPEFSATKLTLLVMSVQILWPSIRQHKFI